MGAWGSLQIRIGMDDIRTYLAAVIGGPIVAMEKGCGSQLLVFVFFFYYYGGIF